MPHRRTKRSNPMPAMETTAQLGTLRSQVTRLEEMIVALQKALVDAKLLPRSVSKPAPGERIATITTQWGCLRQHPAQSYMTTRREVVAPLSAHHPRESSPDRFSTSLVLADDLVGHVVGRGERGLKQVADISSACVSVHSQEIDGHWERLVSIWGTDKQLGDALVVLGKRIAQKRVTVPKKKKGGSAPSAPGNAGPGPSPQAALPKPSTPPPPSSACQTTAPTRGQARPSAAPQMRPQQASLLPPTPSSRTVVMASPSETPDHARMPVMPSVRMASPEPPRSHNDLTSMEVDQILTLVGTDPLGYLPSERRDFAWQYYQQGQVIQTHKGWRLYWATH